MTTDIFSFSLVLPNDEFGLQRHSEREGQCGLVTELYRYYNFALFHSHI